MRARFLASAAVAVLALGAGLLSPGGGVRAGSSPVVSVDAVPDSGNTATTLGNVDYCRAASGGSFTVDVVISGVTGLTGMEARLYYNPAVLRIGAANYRFLIGSTGGTVVELGGTVPDTDGTFELGAVTFPLSPASGSGVLVRLTVEAVGSGWSALDLDRVKLSNATGGPLLPADPVTGEYLGEVADGSVVVGGSCADADGDGFTDAVEAHVGTDPRDNCGDSSGPPLHYSMSWPGDVNSTNFSVNVTDVLDVSSYIAPERRLNKSPGDAGYHPRFDVSPGNGGLADTLNIIDLSTLTTYTVPMFGGLRGFNGPACVP